MFGIGDYPPRHLHYPRQKHRNAACVKPGGCSAVSSCSA